MVVLANLNACFHYRRNGHTRRDCSLSKKPQNGTFNVVILIGAPDGEEANLKNLHASETVNQETVAQNDRGPDCNTREGDRSCCERKEEIEEKILVFCEG